MCTGIVALHFIPLHSMTSKRLDGITFSEAYRCPIMPFRFFAINQAMMSNLGPDKCLQIESSNSMGAIAGQKPTKTGTDACFASCGDQA